MRSLQYAQETGLTLIDKTVISDRKRLKNLMAQYCKDTKVDQENNKSNFNKNDAGFY